MKAFIVTVIAPNEWDKEDILTAINRGMRERAKERGKDIHTSICTSVTISEEFDLKRQDL